MISFENVMCDVFQEQSDLIQILAARVWGLYNGVQTTAIEIILTQYPFINKYYYPG